MEYQHFSQLLDLKEKPRERVPMAVASADEAHTLEAVQRATVAGCIEPILFGDAEKIKQLAEQVQLPLNQDSVIDVGNETEAAEAAVRAVREGAAKILMKGRMQTADIIRAVINKEKGLLVSGKVISLVSFIESPNYHKLFIITDVGINRDPSLEQKREIVKNAVGVLHSYGYAEPKVGVVCAVEVVNPKMPETVDAAELVKMNQSGEIAGCIIEGPMSMDIAVNSENAATKGFQSKVSGDVDIILMPSVLAGNLVAKTLTQLGKCAAVSFAVGASAPMVINSRGASVDDKYNAIVAALKSV